MLLLLLLLMTTTTTTACGYQLMNTQAPFGVGRLCIVPFSESVPFGITGVLSDELARILGSGGVDLSRSPENADAVLTGRVLNGFTGASPNGIGRDVLAYQLTASIRVDLIAPNGKVLWTTVVDVAEEFLPTNIYSSDVLAIEANRRLAMNRLAQTAARLIQQRMMMADVFALLNPPTPPLSPNLIIHPRPVEAPDAEPH